MIASLDLATLLEEADCLAGLIVHSEEAAHYQHCRHVLEKDTAAQALIHQFSQKKVAYEEVQRFGKYHPDYKRVHSEMRQMKRDVDTHVTIAAFKKAEKELETMLGEISQQIAVAVSDTIKVPTGNPFFDAIGCSGKGCGTGNCGCG